MSSSYIFIDHIADIAVEVIADTVEELFSECANAFRESVIDFIPKDEKEQSRIQLDSYSLETLLVNFLNELNFRLTHTKKVFGNISDLKIYQKGNSWELKCVLNENVVDEDKIKTEIKSVTYHQMEIKEVNGKYSTRIVFDI